MPRPLAYDPTTHAAVIDALQRGATMRGAAARARVAESTLFAWLAAGRAHRDGTEGGDERFAQLAADVDATVAEVDLKRIELIDKLGAEDWRALAWAVEHHEAAELTRAKVAQIRAATKVDEMRANGTLVDKHDVTSGGKPIGQMTMEEIDARIAAAEQRRRERGG